MEGGCSSTFETGETGERFAVGHQCFPAEITMAGVQKLPRRTFTTTKDAHLEIEKPSPGGFGENLSSCRTAALLRPAWFIAGAGTCIRLALPVG